VGKPSLCVLAASLVASAALNLLAAHADEIGASADVGASVGTDGSGVSADVGASVGVGGTSVGATGSVGAGTDGASVGATGSVGVGTDGASVGASASVGPGDAGPSSGSGPKGFSNPFSALMSALSGSSGHSTLPRRLRPSGGTGGGGEQAWLPDGNGAELSPHEPVGTQISAMAAVPGTPDWVASACRDWIIEGASPYDPVRVDVASAGSPSDRAGRLVAPLQVRIVYQRAPGLEVRQAVVHCQLDEGTVVAVTYRWATPLRRKRPLV
jgi:hypothetical protein